MPFQKGNYFGEPNKNKKRSKVIGGKISNALKGKMPLNVKLLEKSGKKTRFKKGENYGRVDEKHSGWKGDDVKYSGLHKWIIRKKGNPKICKHCGKIGKKIGKRWNLDYANIDHIYKRIEEDYIGLCRKCHKKFDKENNNI